MPPQWAAGLRSFLGDDPALEKVLELRTGAGWAEIENTGFREGRMRKVAMGQLMAGPQAP